ncbi:MAG: hypothetical protein VKS61_01535, partial [Candidatus Sericytochromatia bacterium]|nr:hypothetical protein [Candidatus Sericytochromatia bacterium]
MKRYQVLISSFFFATALVVGGAQHAAAQVGNCGNGSTQANEDCDPSDPETAECCAANCTWAANGTACGPAPSECAGAGSCDGAGTCNQSFTAAGTPC